MKASREWLEEYSDIDVDTLKLGDSLTMAGQKVETIDQTGNDIKNVVVGKILEIEKHQDSDHLLVTKVDVGTEKLQIVTGAPNIKVGDIVIYTTTQNMDDGTSQYVLVCHRIVKTKVEGETTYYLTKGDNNDVSDAKSVGWLTADKIVGVYENSEYKGSLLSGVGSIYDYLKSFWGFFFVIVLPMILFFIYELIRVIMNIVAYTKEKALVAATEAAQSAELTEAQKQKAIEEYLASQKANENPDKPDNDEKEE